MKILSTRKIYLVNNVIVRLIPIAKQRPAKNRLLPIAINDASNNRTTPRDTNPRPRQIRPIPIFWLSSSTISYLQLDFKISGQIWQELRGPSQRQRWYADRLFFTQKFGYRFGISKFLDCQILDEEGAKDGFLIMNLS